MPKGTPQRESLFLYLTQIRDRVAGSEDDIGRLVGITVFDAAYQHDLGKVAFHRSGNVEIDEVRALYQRFIDTIQRIDLRKALPDPAYAVYCDLKAPFDEFTRSGHLVDLPHTGTSVLLPILLDYFASRQRRFDDAVKNGGSALCNVVTRAGRPDRLNVPEIQRRDLRHLRDTFGYGGHR